MKALTAAEMREVDRLTTERYGIPSLQLMEAAGRGVAESVRQSIQASANRPRRVCVLCGTGNNGGDGLVAARHLGGAGFKVKVLLFGRGEDLRGDPATNLLRWTETGGDVTPIVDEAEWKAAWPEIAAADVILDAIFGTGFRGLATGAIAQAIETINAFSRNATAARPALIVAVDMPTGLPSDGDPAQGPVLHAHKTVTFTAPKVGQLISPDAVTAGALEVVNIGSPAALVEEVGQGALRWIEPGEFAEFPFVRPVASHKGLYGHILVVAGSLGRSGAAVMAGHAALCAGAGLVTIATPDCVLPIVAAAYAESMTEPLFATEAGSVALRNLEGGHFARLESGKTVLAVGPGLGTHPETQQFIRTVVRQTELPVVLDADGLNAFAGRADELRDRKPACVAITPHPGEMARLAGVSTKEVENDRVKTALNAAREWNVHVLLKGFHTVIAAPDGLIFVNTTGNPGLAKGGSGDVLTGILAALTGQFKTRDWVRVLALGAYLHGVAADLAVAGTDPSGLVASEVAAAVPKARQRLVQELQRHA